MEGTETVAANTQTATTAVEAPTTSTATAATDTGKQTQTEETQTTQSTGKPATETTTTEAAKPAAETKTDTAPVVPEKYEFKAPEGAEFDPAVIEAYSGAAKVAGLSQDAAQKLIETMAPALAKRQADQIEAIRTQWRVDSAADKEIGGEKFQENLGVAKKAYDNFATPELRKLLDDTDLGSHPEVLRLMFRIGKAISEDKVVVGNTGTTKTGAAATKVLYPTMNE